MSNLDDLKPVVGVRDTTFHHQTNQRADCLLTQLYPPLKFISWWFIDFISWWFIDFISWWFIDFICWWFIDFISWWFIDFISWWFIDIISWWFIDFIGIISFRIVIPYLVTFCYCLFLSKYETVLTLPNSKSVGRLPSVFPNSFFPSICRWNI